MADVVPPGAYRDAMVAARGLRGNLETRMARNILRSLETYVGRLEAGLTNLPPGTTARRAAELSVRINRQAAEELRATLLGAVEQDRRVLFEETTEIWERAGFRAAEAAGISSATIGRIRTPPLNMLGAYEAVGASSNWRTLLRGHIDNAVEESANIVRMGMLSGSTGDEIARGMRRYVVGSERLDEFFEDKRIDFRKVPDNLQGAARTVDFNARRIGFSELQNGRHEAELQSMVRDPLVEGVRWLLSPDRGSLRPPDECDVLAGTDFFGMGVGVFPFGSVPSPPHPLDRCEKEPVTRAVEDIGKPMPNPDRKINPEDVGMVDCVGLAGTAVAA